MIVIKLDSSIKIEDYGNVCRVIEQQAKNGVVLIPHDWAIYIDKPFGNNKIKVKFQNKK